MLIASKAVLPGRKRGCPRLPHLTQLTYLTQLTSLALLPRAFHFLNRKNCAPPDIELVTKNWPPATAGEFVQSTQTWVITCWFFLAWLS